VRVLIVLSLMLAPAFASAQQTSAPTEPVVVTTGEGVIQAAPDRAWITITAESRAGSPREAQRRNTEMMAPVQDALRAARVPADAIRTVAYDLQQEWDFVNNKRVSRGYVARNSIEVRVDDITRVGELLEMAVGQGATAVSGLRFDLKDRAKLERDALRLAVAAARAKADAAASGAGRTVDRILRIDEHGGVISPPMPLAMARAGVNQIAAAEAAPISVGQLEIRANVTVTAAIK
jgi:uncharacterized protein